VIERGFANRIPAARLLAHCAALARPRKYRNAEHLKQVHARRQWINFAGAA
jgi:hypothetical protein